MSVVLFMVDKTSGLTHRADAVLAMTVGLRHCERERRNLVGDWRRVSV
jgi:hypothetical protein